MHKQWMGLLFLMMVLVGCCASPTPTPTPVATASPTGNRPAGGGVAASGEVVPIHQVMLGFTLAGKVQSVAVAAGEEVGVGQVLVVLQTDALEAGVAQAEAGVKAAQARLALLEAGPRPEQVALAEAQLKVAEAALSQAMVERGRPDLRATEAAIAVAEADVAQAQADRRAAVEYHDKTLTCVEVKIPDGGKKTICPALGPYEEQTRYALQLADEALAAAQAHLDALHAGAGTGVRAVEAAISAAEAQRDAAQAQLDLVRSGVSAEDITVAKARVAQAKGALDAAQAAWNQGTLHAPFAGTVASVGVSAGETAVPGQMVLKLADLSYLQVATTDLSEQDVARLTVGQQATVYVEPLGLEVGGRVVRVASRAEVLGGDVVYRVVVELDEQPAGLRWGMSADVEITTD